MHELTRLGQPRLEGRVHIKVKGVRLTLHSWTRQRRQWPWGAADQRKQTAAALAWLEVGKRRDEEEAVAASLAGPALGQCGPWLHDGPLHAAAPITAGLLHGSVLPGGALLKAPAAAQLVDENIPDVMVQHLGAAI
jgi:hypothetical protein